MTDFNKFTVEYDGTTYTSEFDMSTILKWEEMGAMENKDRPIEFTFITFYASILKNHPYATQRKVREFFNEIIKDPEYGIEAFEDIVDEATRIYMILFTSKGEKKKKFKSN